MIDVLDVGYTASSRCSVLVRLLSFAKQPVHMPAPDCQRENREKCTPKVRIQHHWTEAWSHARLLCWVVLKMGLLGPALCYELLFGV